MALWPPAATARSALSSAPSEHQAVAMAVARFAGDGTDSDAMPTTAARGPIGTCIGRRTRRIVDGGRIAVALGGISWV